MSLSFCLFSLFSFFFLYQAENKPTGRTSISIIYKFYYILFEICSMIYHIAFVHFRIGNFISVMKDLNILCFFNNYLNCKLYEHLVLFILRHTPWLNGDLRLQSLLLDNFLSPFRWRSQPSDTKLKQHQHS